MSIYLLDANHVIQKIVTTCPPDLLQFVVDAFHGNVYTFATHPYSCPAFGNGMLGIGAGIGGNAFNPRRDSGYGPSIYNNSPSVGFGDQFGDDRRGSRGAVSPYPHLLSGVIERRFSFRMLKLCGMFSSGSPGSLEAISMAPHQCQEEACLPILTAHRRLPTPTLLHSVWPQGTAEVSCRSTLPIPHPRTTAPANLRFSDIHRWAMVLVVD